MDEQSSLCYYVNFLDTEYIEISEDRKTALCREPDADKKRLWARWIKMSMRFYLQSERHVRFRELTLQVDMPSRFVLNEEGEIVFEIEWKKLLEDILKEGIRCREFRAQKGTHNSQTHAT